MKYINLNVTKGCKHLAQWDGMYNIPHGRILLNKSITGCGATTYYLNNEENVILCSPRVQLLTCKLKDRNISKSLFYYDSLNSTRDYDLRQYVNSNSIHKILVTYDSFDRLADFMENSCHFNLSAYRIVVDEYQEIFNDAHFKSNTELRFISHVFRYPNLLFITATPVLEKYLCAIPEFDLIDYIIKLEFDPSDYEEILPITKPMKSVLKAFGEILMMYLSKGYFDIIKALDGSGNCIYSSEAVFYLNNVNEICHILKKYKDQLKGKVNIICADTENNKRKLTHAGGFCIGTIPGEQDARYPFTFVTRTAFAGVDMYSDNASTYVFADYRIDAMLVDVSLDLRQIAGRQRWELNQFRDKITVFYKENTTPPTEEEFRRLQDYKSEVTNGYLRNLEGSPDKTIAMMSIRDRVLIESKEILRKDEKRESYLSITEDGTPVFNNFIKVAEQRQFEMVKYRNLPLLIAKGLNNNGVISNPILAQLKADLEANSYDKKVRLKIITEYYENYPGDKYELEKFIAYLGYGEETEYLNKLGTQRLHATGFNTTRLAKELYALDYEQQIRDNAGKVFKSGSIYTPREAKVILQSIYDSLGLQRTAKATELCNYITCRSTKREGKKVYIIL